MTSDHYNLQGLDDGQVEAARIKYGPNKLSYKKTNGFWEAVKSLAKDPMIKIGRAHV